MAESSGKSKKGVILAGGHGTRLYPLTMAVNKQLLPVYNKPMIYYPLTTLMLAGIRDIVIVSSPQALPQFQACLGDGRSWGLRLDYAAQPSPGGIAQGLLVAEEHIEGHSTALILGDNIFYGTGLPQQLTRAAGRPQGATIFAYAVSQPEDFGVVTLDRDGRPLSLMEKPKQSSSNLAVPGVYFYDAEVLDLARRLRPSVRGELEITDLNRLYLERGQLCVEMLGRGSAWFDGGTHRDLFDAGQFVRVIEERTGLMIACPEEVALHMGFIGLDELKETARRMQDNSYGAYLRKLVAELSLERRGLAAPVPG